MTLPTNQLSIFASSALMTPSFRMSSETPKGTTASASQCNIFIGAEPRFSNEAQQVGKCFQDRQIPIRSTYTTSSTHYFLFITKSFLESKEHLHPLIKRMVSDPHFNLRLFPVVMEKLSIFTPGDEQQFVDYWDKILENTRKDSSEYAEVLLIQENIAAFIRALRYTLIPSLDNILLNFESILDKIKERSHLLDEKHFFFLPKLKTRAIVKPEAAFAKICSLFENKHVVTLTGQPGMGKTTLAIEYAKQSDKYPSGIFWFDASNEETLEESYRQLSVQLRTNPASAKAELNRTRKFLLIFDNVTDPSIIARPPFAHTLLVGPNLSTPDIVLKGFSKDESTRYVREQLGASIDDAVLLGDLLKTTPAELAEATDYITQSKMKIKDYVRFYNENRQALLEKQSKALNQVKETQVSLSRPPPSIFDITPHVSKESSKKSAEELAKELKDLGIQIFVSYSWSCKDQVEQMDGLFNKMGIQLLKDSRELQTFENVRQFMQKSIRHADYTISLINDKYLESPNCLFEIIATMRDRDWKSRLIPLIMPGTKLDDEAILSYKNYWLKKAEELSSPDDVAIAKEGAEKIEAYLRFIKEVQPKSIAHHLNDEFKSVMEIMISRQEKLDKKGMYKRSVFHLPMGRNTNFTGREEEMKVLEEALKAGQYSAITNTGMGGVGKSQLALEYAYTHMERYDMVYWINSETMESLRAGLRMLGQEMGVAEEFLKDDVVISVMRGLLEGRKRWLLIFDNAEDPAALRTAMPQVGGHIIVTSRNPNWENSLPITVFSNDDAVSCLQRNSGISGQEDNFKLLAKELGYLPLALSQAGSYIRQQGIDAATYLAAFLKGQKDLLSQRGKGYPGSVATAWLMSMEKIAIEDPNAVKLLNICSILAPDNIPEDFLKKSLKAKNGKDADLDFHEALRVLESYSLINQVEEKEDKHKLISVHRLIQTVTRESCDKEELKNLINLCIEVLDPEKQGIARNYQQREAAKAIIAHANVLFSLAEENKIVNERVGDLAQSIGFIFDVMEHKGSMEMHEKALRIYRETFGTDQHIKVAYCLFALWNTYSDKGKPNESVELIQKALEILRQHYKTNVHRDIGRAYKNLGGALRKLDKFDEAREMYDEARKVYLEYHKSEDHRDVSELYACYGHLEKKLQNYPKAKEMFEKSLKSYLCWCTKEKMDNKDVEEIADIYFNLMQVDILQLEIVTKETKEYAENALEVYRKYYGTENHPSVAKCYLGIGSMLVSLGHRKEGITKIEKALQISTNCLGENQLWVAACNFILAAVLFELRDFKDARAHVEKGLEIIKYCEKEDDPFAAFGFAILGNILITHGDRQGAKEAIEKALKILSLSKSDTFIDCNLHYLLGIAILKLGDISSGKEFLEKSLNSFIKTRNSEISIDIAAIYTSLAGIHISQGEMKSAQEYVEKALRVFQVLKEAKHPNLARIYTFQGALHVTQKDFIGAEEKLNQALQLYFSLGIESGEELALCYCILWSALAGQEKLIEMQEKHDKIMEMYGFIDNQMKLKLIESYNSLGKIYEGQHNYENAKKCYENALQMNIAFYGTENNDKVADSYAKLGELFWTSSNIEEAKKNYEKAANIYAICNDKNKLIFCYLVLGLLSWNMGNIREAQGPWEKGMETFLEKQDAGVGLHLCCYLASMYEKLGNIELAQQCMDHYSSIMKNRQENFNEVLHPIVLGELCWRQGDYTNERVHHENLLKIINDQTWYITYEYYKAVLTHYYGKCYGENNQKSLARGNRNLGDVFFELGKYNDALDYYLRAKEIYNQIGNDYGTVVNDRIKECESKGAQAGVGTSHYKCLTYCI